MGDLVTSITVSASALKAQSLRMRVIAENIANQDSLATVAGGTPYRRKVVEFKNDLDRATGAARVRADRVSGDRTAFGKEHKPGHPAADSAGYVLTPNVNSLVELTDMAGAQRSYEANLSAIEAAKALTMHTVDLMK